MGDDPGAIKFTLTREQVYQKALELNSGSLEQLVTQAARIHLWTLVLHNGKPRLFENDGNAAVFCKEQCEEWDGSNYWTNYEGETLHIFQLHCEEAHEHFSRSERRMALDTESVKREDPSCVERGIQHEEELRAEHQTDSSSPDIPGE